MPQSSDNPTSGTLRVGSVSYLNAKPLIEGLDSDPGIQLSLRVPSRLIEGLADQSFDVALLPVIDYQKLPGLRIVPSGGICCDGPTLTVRIFSKTPIDRISTLSCDTDSHTSVALARIIFAERYHTAPRFVDFSERGAPDASGSDAAAQLLIGDKVVCQEPMDMPYQLDLGDAWKNLTGRPFVFAIWTARPGVDLGDLPARLDLARQRGLARVPEIVHRHALPHGWPQALALQYLTRYLKFEIGPAQLSAIEYFHALAARHGLIDSPPIPLTMA